MKNSKTVITTNTTKDAKISFRLEYFLKEELEFMADNRGLNVSEMLRELIDKELTENG